MKVIECTLRASRSFPFVSKVLKRNFIETATRIMLDARIRNRIRARFDIDWIGIKASQFSFARLHKADPVLGVDTAHRRGRLYRRRFLNECFAFRHDRRRQQYS